MPSSDGRSDDPEARVRAVREWALSLSAPTRSPRGNAQLDDIRHLLPPLKSLKGYPVYVPNMSSSNGGGGVLSARLRPPKGVGADDGDAPLLDGLDGEARARRFKGSKLGQVEMPTGVSGATLPPAPPSDMVSAFAATNRAAIRGLSPPRAAHGQRQPLSEPCRTSVPKPIKYSPVKPALYRAKTVLREEGKPVVRGTDPMAGSLFARDTNLDAFSKDVGLYEASLARKSARRPS